MAIVPFDEAIAPPDPLTSWVKRMEEAVRRAREAAEMPWLYERFLKDWAELTREGLRNAEAEGA